MNGFFNKNYKRLMIVPILLLMLFIFIAFFNPGIEQGIDLKGGNQIIVRYELEKDYSGITPRLIEEYGFQEVQINQTKSPNEYGLLIQFSHQEDIELAKASRKNIDFVNQNIDNLKISLKELFNPLIDLGVLDNSVINEIDSYNNSEDLKEFTNQTLILAGNNFNNSIISIIKDELNLEDDAKIQVREVSATLGSDFINSSIKVGIWAFVFLITVILLFFRELIPSGLIIFASIFDIFAALAGMALFKLPLNLTTIPAILMLIGYSVDTDILLSSKLLKNKHGDPIKIANQSLKTGITMTLTTISTILVMLIISYYTQMLVIFEISLVLLCGLVGDVISTWFFNGPALISYVEYKKKKQKK